MHISWTQKYVDGRRIVRLLSRLRAQDGQSLVELAFMLPLLVLLMMIVIQFARVGFAAIEVNNAAHAGAIYGSQGVTTANDTNGMVAAAENDGFNILGWKITGLTATAGQTCTCNGAAINCTGATCDSHLIEYVQVSTQATVDPLFYFPGLPKSYTLNGYSNMRAQ